MMRLDSQPDVTESSRAVLFDCAHRQMNAPTLMASPSEYLG